MSQIELIIPEEAASSFEELPSHYKVERRSNYYEFADDGGNWVVFTLSWLASIPAGMLATVILDAIRSGTKKRPSKIAINREWIEFEDGIVTRHVKEKINFEE